MLNDADISRFYHVYVFVGKTDLRKGIDGLSTLVKQKFQLDPFHAGDLFLFCGSSNRKNQRAGLGGRRLPAYL